MPKDRRPLVVMTATVALFSTACITLNTLRTQALNPNSRIADKAEGSNAATAEFVETFDPELQATSARTLEAYQQASALLDENRDGEAIARLEELSRAPLAALKWSDDRKQSDITAPAVLIGVNQRLCRRALAQARQTPPTPETAAAAWTWARRSRDLAQHILSSHSRAIEVLQTAWAVEILGAQTEREVAKRVGSPADAARAERRVAALQKMYRTEIFPEIKAASDRRTRARTTGIPLTAAELTQESQLGATLLPRFVTERQRIQAQQS